MITTTTTTAAQAAPAPLCQTCRAPIRPDEAVNVCPGLHGSIWYMHASVAQCLARLSEFPRDQIAATLARK